MKWSPTANDVQSALRQNRVDVDVSISLVLNGCVHIVDEEEALLVEHVEEAFKNLEVESGRQKTSAGPPAVSFRRQSMEQFTIKVNWADEPSLPVVRNIQDPSHWLKYEYSWPFVISSWLFNMGCHKKKKPEKTKKPKKEN